MHGTPLGPRFNRGVSCAVKPRTRVTLVHTDYHYHRPQGPRPPHARPQLHRAQMQKSPPKRGQLPPELATPVYGPRQAETTPSQAGFTIEDTLVNHKTAALPSRPHPACSIPATGSTRASAPLPPPLPDLPTPAPAAQPTAQRKRPELRHVGRCLDRRRLRRQTTPVRPDRRHRPQPPPNR